MNRLVLYIVVVQICLCIIIAIIGTFWYKDKSDEALYLPFSFNVGSYGFIDFFSYFLLLNTMLPISLIVTLEVVKVIQSYFIMSDVKMYALDRDRMAKV